VRQRRRGQGDGERGDGERGDTGTQGDGDAETRREIWTNESRLLLAASPNLPVSLSPDLRVSGSSSPATQSISPVDQETNRRTYPRIASFSKRTV
jgi:hypothetical protein